MIRGDSMLRRTSLFILFFFFLVPTLYPVSAQVATSNCVVTKVGNPAITPVLPPACAKAPPTGIIYPPNMICKSDGYCLMPPATDGSYQIYSCGGTGTGKRWGRKELIGVLYTVAKRWKEKNPTGYLRIGDMNASNHLSHFWGIAVDLNARPTPDTWAANRNYLGTMSEPPFSTAKTIELGKLIADTGYFYTIWHNNAATWGPIYSYAKTSESAKRYKFTLNLPGLPGIRPDAGHFDHFHLNIGPSSFRLPLVLHGC